MYFKRTKEYIPIIFRNDKYENKNIIDLQFDINYKWENDSKNQFSFDNIFNQRFYRVQANRVYSIKCGNGIIFEGRDNLPEFKLIICFKSEIIEFNEENKRKLVFLVSDQIRNSSLSKIKKMMNLNGFSSRTQIKIITDGELNRMFAFDPLAPSFEDHLGETKKRVSNEFILKMRNNNE